MKLIGLSCIMAGLLLAGCRKPVAQTDENNDATPTVAAAPTVPPAPPRPEYAPPGFFYLLAPVRKETKDGIIRLLPGTEVKLTRNGKYLTPEGEMTLDPKILTNDAAQGRAARDADHLAQTTAYPRGAAPAAVAPAVTTANRPGVPTTIDQATPAQLAPNDAGIRAMRFKLGTLKREAESVEANLNYLNDKASHFGYARAAPPAGLNGTTNFSDWDSLNKHLIALRAEIESLENKLALTSK